MTSMKMWIAVIAFVSLTASPLLSFGLKPEHVAVIYNENSSDGRVLAETYMKLRGIPPENLVPLSCSPDEVISRQDYEETIRLPLRAIAEKKSWWMPTGNPNDPAHARKIFALVLMRGMPLKVANDPALKKTGIQSDAAAVDSELAMLVFDGVPTPGMIVNAYYGKDEEIVGSGFPYMLVARIDGPSAHVCLSMMHDAVDVEKKGLWGWAQVDKGGPYPQGNEWMDKIASMAEESGIPTMLDTWPQTLPARHPLGNDVAIYFGWYAGHGNGPLLAPSFRFKRGAVAVHIHSFSAFTVRTTDKYWVGPILNKGAAVTLGNVFEPYLDITHHLDIFFERLMAGYTVAEAAGMSIRAWSWQNVVFGDPLYRPFSCRKEEKIDKSETDKYFQAWYIAHREWGKNPVKLEANLSEAAPGGAGGMFCYEALGNRALNRKDFSRAREYFSKALIPASLARDRIRLRMACAEVSRREGDKKKAVAELDALIGLYPETEWSSSFKELKDRLQPPLRKPKAAEKPQKPAGKQSGKKVSG